MSASSRARCDGMPIRFVKARKASPSGEPAITSCPSNIRPSVSANSAASSARLWRSSAAVLACIRSPYLATSAGILSMSCDRAATRSASSSAVAGGAFPASHRGQLRLQRRDLLAQGRCPLLRVRAGLDGNLAQLGHHHRQRGLGRGRRMPPHVADLLHGLMRSCRQLVPLGPRLVVDAPVHPPLPRPPAQDGVRVAAGVAVLTRGHAQACQVLPYHRGQRLAVDDLPLAQVRGHQRQVAAAPPATEAATSPHQCRHWR